MAALTLFPLQFQRQAAEPIDVDQTFATTAERVAYLSSPRRYAGQVVIDVQQNQGYYLSADLTTWILLGGGLIVQEEGVALGSGSPSSMDFVGGGVVASRVGDTVDVEMSGGGSVAWGEWPLKVVLPALGRSTFNVNGVVNTVNDSSASFSNTVPGLGTVTAAPGSIYSIGWDNSIAAKAPTVLLNGSYTELGYGLGNFNVLGLPIVDGPTPGHVIVWTLVTNRVGIVDPVVPADYYKQYTSTAYSSFGLPVIIRFLAPGFAVGPVNGNKGIFLSYGGDRGFYYPTEVTITATVDGFAVEGTLTLTMTPIGAIGGAGATSADVTYARTSTIGQTTLADYVFTPIVSNQTILYRISFKVNAIFLATAGFRVWGMSGSGSVPTSRVLFRKDMLVFKDVGNGYFEGGFDYVHYESNQSIHLFFEEKSGLASNIRGTWTIREVSRLANDCVGDPGPFDFRDDFDGYAATLNGHDSGSISYFPWVQFSGSTALASIYQGSAKFVNPTPFSFTAARSGGLVSSTKMEIGWRVNKNSTFMGRFTFVTYQFISFSIFTGFIDVYYAQAETAQGFTIDTSLLNGREFRLVMDKSNGILELYVCNTLVDSSPITSDGLFTIPNTWNGDILLQVYEVIPGQHFDLDYMYVRNTI